MLNVEDLTLFTIFGALIRAIFLLSVLSMGCAKVLPPKQSTPPLSPEGYTYCGKVYLRAEDACFTFTPEGLICVQCSGQHACFEKLMGVYCVGEHGCTDPNCKKEPETVR